MNKLNFKVWVESTWNPPKRWRRRVEAKEPDNPRKGLPILPFKAGMMMQELSNYSINNLEPKMKYSNEVHWGDGPGAMRIYIGTGLNVVLERMIIDKSGKNRWITKKVYQINQNAYSGLESSVVTEILDKILKVNESKLDSFKNEFISIENLVGKIYNSIIRTAKPIFKGQGIKKVNENTFIIRLMVKGQGAGAPGHNRILENQTTVFYDDTTGIIRMINTNLETPMGSGGKWEIREADTDFKFLPTQSSEEIAETISNTLHWY